MSKNTMSFSLPEDMRRYIDERVAEGHYGNTSEYLRDLVRRDQRDRALTRVRELIAEGLASGPAELVTEEEERDLEAMARGRKR